MADQQQRVAVPRDALTRCLAALPNAVVLRNEEDLFGNLERGGDIDLLTDERPLVERALIHHLGRPTRITRASYATGYSYDWGHIDVLETIEWRGACYLETTVVLAGRRVSASGRSVPRLAHEALISWLTSVLWGGFFNARYAAIIDDAVAADGDAFRRALRDATGKRWGARLWRTAVDRRVETSAQWTQSLRRAVWWRSCINAPMQTLRRYFAYVAGQLRLRWQPPVPWIAIVGPDETAKSSVMSEIEDRFATCPYASVRVFHRHPRMATAHAGDTAAEQHGAPIRRVTVALKWFVDYWTKWVHLTAKGYVVAFDHIYLDLVVDPRRNHVMEPTRLVRALWWLLPKPDVVFLMASQSDVEAKHGIPPSELTRQRTDRPLLRPLPAPYRLDRSLPPGVLADEIQRVIRSWMIDRSVGLAFGIDGAAEFGDRAQASPTPLPAAGAPLKACTRVIEPR